MQGAAKISTYHFYYYNITAGNLTLVPSAVSDIPHLYYTLYRMAFAKDSRIEDAAVKWLPHAG